MAFEDVGVRAVVQGFSPYMAQMGQMEAKTQGFASKIGAGLRKASLIGVAAVGAIGVASLKMGMDFEKSMAEVRTLLPDISDEVFGKLRSDILGVSKEFGIATDKAVPALYQAISAGVPKENVVEFLKTNAKLAIGGVTDLETAVDLTTTAINAFGLEASDAEKVADILFTGVKLGKTTVAELGASLFQVAPAAAASGVALEDVTAALATLTASGTPTAQASTQVRQALVELGKEGTAANKAFQEVAGVGFRQFIEEGGNLGEAMVFLAQKAEEEGVAVSDLFGSIEAGLGVQVLAGEGADKFAESLDATTDSADANNKAFETMAQTASFKLNKAINIVKVTMTDLGSRALPVIVNAIETLGKAVSEFIKLNLKEVLVGIGVVGAIAGAAIVAAWAPVIAGFLIAAAPVVAIGVALAAIAAAAALIEKKTGFFSQVLLPAIKDVMGIAQQLGDVFIRALGKDTPKSLTKLPRSLHGIAFALTDIAKFARNVFLTVKEVIRVVDELGTVFLHALTGETPTSLSKLPPSLKGVGRAVVSVARFIRKDFLPAVKAVVGAIGDWLKKHGPAILRHVKEFAQVLFKLAKGVVTSILLPALDTLIDLWGALWPVVKKLADLFVQHVAPVLKAIGGFLLEHKPILIAVAAAILLLVAPWLAVVAAIAVVLAKWDEISAFFIGIGKTIEKFVKDVIQKVSDFPIIGEIIKDTVRMAKIYVETVLAIIAELFEAALDTIINTFKFWKAIFTGDWDAAWNAVKDQFKVIVDLLSGLFGIALDAVKAIFDSKLQMVMGIGGDLGHLIVDAAKKVWEDLKRQFGEQVNAIGAWVAGSVDTIKGIGAAVGRAIMEGFSDGLRAAEGFVKGALNFLITLVEKGINAVIGLINAIPSIELPFGGGTIGIPHVNPVNIDRLHRGAWEIPRDMVAQLQAGEMVLPQRQAEVVRDVVLAPQPTAIPGLDQLAQALEGRGGSGDMIANVTSPSQEQIAEEVGRALRGVAFEVGRVSV